MSSRSWTASRIADILQPDALVPSANSAHSSTVRLGAPDGRAAGQPSTITETDRCSHST